MHQLKLDQKRHSEAVDKTPATTKHKTITTMQSSMSY